MTNEQILKLEADFPVLQELFADTVSVAQMTERGKFKLSLKSAAEVINESIESAKPAMLKKLQQVRSSEIEKVIKILEKRGRKREEISYIELESELSVQWPDYFQLVEIMDSFNTKRRSILKQESPLKPEKLFKASDFPSFKANQIEEKREFNKKLSQINDSLVLLM